MASKYRTDSILFKDLGKMTKPTFQRGLRWKQKKQNELIDTIRDGLPFGTFLLDEKGKNKYSVLDGQQRYTTLKNYKEDMTSFMSEKDIDVASLVKSLISIQEIKFSIKKLQSKIERISYKKIFKANKSNERTTMKDIRKEIIDVLSQEIAPSESAREKIEDVLEDWVHETLKPIDVDNISIPVIILTNEIDDKADVFIKLNQGGVKLNKYELLAAKWNDKSSRLNCKDNEIIDAVVNKYKNPSNKEIEYDDFKEEDIRNFSNGNKNITAYEYLYGLSKIIDAKIEKICDKEKNDESAYGFLIVSEVFNIPAKDMKGLDTKLAKFGDLIDLKNKILESVEAIFKILSKELKAPNGIIYTDHTDNQIVSFIVTYFKTKYIIENDKKIVIRKGQANKINLSNLSEYLMQHYIIDNLKDKWVGSGDKNLHDMVKNEVIKNSKYYQSVDESEMKYEIGKWFADKNVEIKKTIKPDTKMMLAYLLNKTARSLTDKIGNLEFEHIGIKSKLEDEHILEGISSPANLTLIPALDNKKKQRLTYYEYKKTMKNSLFKFSVTDLEKLLYPKHDNIKWVEGTKTIKKSEFDKFKKERTELLVNKFMAFLFNE